MIADLKPYAAYKDSGLPWLGQVPEHWSISRIKTVLQELDGRSTDGEGTLLSLTRVRGLIAHSDRTDKVHSAKTLVGYKLYQPGEIVMNRMQAWSGMFGAGTRPGLVSPDYAVFKILGGHDTKLVLERLKTPDLVGQFTIESTGIGSGFNRLYTDSFGPIPISLPPLEEQVAIVRFLDWANGRLERTIRAKRRVIALLTEQKQAIIHRAVTRGLDPAVPLKPSGIPWLGDIPQHWEVRRCGGLFFEVIDVGHPDALLLSIDRKKGVIPQSETGRKVRASENRGSYKRVLHGQLAYNLMNAFMGSLGFSQYEGIVSPAYAVAQPRSEIETGFFHHLFRTTAYTGEFNRLSYGIMYERNRLYFERFKLVPALVPPLAEQRTIFRGIQERTLRLDVAISRIEREMELLLEYRTRLVADVVTGKIDVREAAARLPLEEVESSIDTAVQGDDVDMDRDEETELEV
ncbi:Type I restriction-modification system, specificity subunit S [Polaromonas sp. CG9_12]|nr:Type I restriction-modification system, specificity subunit S [Polaromonas sp. CG9_12]